MKNKVTARMKREARKGEMLKIIRTMENERQMLSYRSTSSQRKDFKYALKSIKIKADTANNIDWKTMSKVETDLLIQEMINNGYTLSYNSPTILRGNLDIVLSSIRNNPNCIECVSNELLNGEHKDIIIKELINNGYVLKRYNTPNMLKSNLDIAIASVKKNPSSINYVDSDIRDNPEIDKYCYDRFNYDELTIRPIINYNDKKMIKTVFEKFDVLNNCN